MSSGWNVLSGLIVRCSFFTSYRGHVKMFFVLQIYKPTIFLPCVIKTSLMRYLLQFISSFNLYMFRAYLWPIIRRYTVYIQQFVRVVQFSWLSVGLVTYLNVNGRKLISTLWRLINDVGTNGNIHCTFIHFIINVQLKKFRYRPISGPEGPRSLRLPGFETVGIWRW
jgi:hypothetical protein